MNNLTTPGVYKATLSCTNKPHSLNGVCIVMERNGVIIQKYYSSERSSRIYYRAFEGGSWGTWKRNYDESILSDNEVLPDLASALGVLVPYNAAPNADLNNAIYEKNIITQFKSSDMQNCPVESGVQCMLVCFHVYVHTMQVIWTGHGATQGGGELYIRYVWGGNFSRPWRKATMTNVS